MNSENSQSGVDQDLIGSATSAEEIVRALAKRGCSDLTSTIDLGTCGTLPLAGGGFCDVYRGEMRSGDKIAIKSLRLYDRAGKEKEKEKILKRAARELYHWSKLKHANVLPLMGLAMFRGHLSMVSEWMENGSLMSYISLNPSVDRIGLCLDICVGLSYIHQNDMASSSVHGDLKAANVMVTRDGRAIIADFGNSRLKDLTLKFTNTTSSSLSVRWAAPELLVGDGVPQVSKKSDVYAYGMTALETLTGQVPYEEFGEHKVLVLVALKHEPPARPAVGISDKAWKILQSCWTWKPSERAEITKINAQLRELYCHSWAVTRSLDKTGAGCLETNEPAFLVGDFERALRTEAEQAKKFRGQGRLVESESFWVEILAARKRFFGATHPETLQTMAALADIYLERARPEIETLRFKTLASRQEVFGGERSEAIVHIHSQGQLAKSLSLCGELLAARKQVLGDEHPETMQSMAALVNIYIELGRPEAETLCVETLEVRKRVLGTGHHETLESMTCLTGIYHTQDRLEEAESLWVETLATQRQVLGTEHPETLKSMATLAGIYFEQARPEAESLWAEIVDARKRVLGAEHPETLQSMAALASIYFQLGRSAEAELLCAETMTTWKRVLELEQPETLRSLGALGSSYFGQNKPAEAELLGAETLTTSTRKPILRADHPRTLENMRSLAHTLEVEGRYAAHRLLVTEIDKIAGK